MAAYHVHYPKGHGQDLVIADDQLTMTITRGGWVLFADQGGPCAAIPAHAGATITRIDQDPGDDGEP